MTVDSILHLGSRRNLTAHTEAQTIVEESLGKLEIVVSMQCTGSIERVVDSHAYIKSHGAHGGSCNVVDFGIEERAEGTVHRERIGIAVGKIHARSQHGDSHLAAFVHTHRVQLILDVHVGRC